MLSPVTTGASFLQMNSICNDSHSIVWGVLLAEASLLYLPSSIQGTHPGLTPQPTLPC